MNSGTRNRHLQPSRLGVGVDAFMSGVRPVIDPGGNLGDGGVQWVGDLPVLLMGKLVSGCRRPASGCDSDRRFLRRSLGCSTDARAPVGLQEF
jgi:hypothetical protein